MDPSQPSSPALGEPAVAPPPADDRARAALSAGRRERIRQAVHPSVIAEPLKTELERDAPGVKRHVIIELNVDYAGDGADDAGDPRTYVGGRERAYAKVTAYLTQILGEAAKPALARNLLNAQHPYLFAELARADIYELLALDGSGARQKSEAVEQAKAERAEPSAPPAPHRKLRAVFKVWESAKMRPLTTISVRTVKADAAQTAYGASGKDIVWAVLDSGIDAKHPHFAEYGNVVNDAPLLPKSFLADTDTVSADPLQDPFGHGTHCAGIIAGGAKANAPAMSAEQSVSAEGTTGEYHLKEVSGIHGMAPQCKLLSLKILAANGSGDVTAAINALEYVMQLNSYGAHILVHGVNLSTGYLPDPQCYGIGSTPLCRQVDRAVRSGICVVVAAGNTGYVQTEFVQDGAVAGIFQAAQLSSINDPGNAKLAITVGSTHREEPHTYGVSYFSSKGPTADGRQKPDVVAPGERIVSCAAGSAKATVDTALRNAGTAGTFDYIEDTGTSMAAPHVSGIIAAFLSIRREFIGESEQVRKLVRRSAMDLRRDRRVQGAGLVDLMRLIESV